MELRCRFIVCAMAFPFVRMTKRMYLELTFICSHCSSLSSMSYLLCSVRRISLNKESIRKLTPSWDLLNPSYFQHSMVVIALLWCGATRMKFQCTSSRRLERSTPSMFTWLNSTRAFVFVVHRWFYGNSSFHDIGLRGAVISYWLCC